MKKLAVFGLVAAMGLTLLSACGKSEKDMVYLKDFKASKYVDLGEYKGLKVEASKAEVTDEELNTYMDYMMMYYTETKEVEGRDVVEDGDIANIDYEGKIDGELFDGGSSEDYDLYIGSGSFISGFESGLVGKKVGDEVELNLTFPDDYWSEESAGKDVVFTVKINSIKEEVVPELTDEFVASMGEGLETVEELKNQLYEDLLSDEVSNRENQITSAIQEQLKNTCSVKKVPSGFSDRLYDTLINSLKEMAEEYGMEVSTIASYYYGVSEDNYEAEVRSYIDDTMAPQYIILAAIAEKEGIVVSDEDMDKEIQEMLDSYGSDYTVEDYKEMIGDTEAYREYIITNKVLDLLSENAEVTDITDAE